MFAPFARMDSGSAIVCLGLFLLVTLVETSNNSGLSRLAVTVVLGMGMYLGYTLIYSQL